LTTEHTYSSLESVKPLTQRQAQVLRLIAESVRKSGYPPTVRELCARLGLASPNAVSCHLRALERKGRIRRSPQSPRAIELVGAATGIPVLGRIAAGEPILAVEETDHRLDVQADFFGGGELFALRVKGDSMVGDHIIDGDVVVVRRQEHVSQGEIAAVLLDDDVTLKRVYRNGGQLELRSSNPAVPPITVKSGQAEPRLLGKAVGVIRKR
jgi:repressor LexA